MHKRVAEAESNNLPPPRPVRGVFAFEFDSSLLRSQIKEYNQSLKGVGGVVFPPLSGAPSLYRSVY